MSAYPTLTHDISSARNPRGGIKVDTAEDGTPRARTLYSATVYDVSILHRAQTSTNRDLVTAHYDSNKNASFSYTWPDGSVAMTAVYAEAPRVEWTPGGWDVSVALVATVT
jgi:hypothetical protein